MINTQLRGEMEIEIDGFYFTSNFDSGNLARVESINPYLEIRPDAPNFSKEQQSNPATRIDHRFFLWTKPDCAETPFENGNRTWFHFSVRCRRHTGSRVQFVMQNLNKQTRLYSQGMAPVFRTKPGTKQYERIPILPTYWSDDEQFFLSFVHVMPASSRATTYFAFTYPYSYEELQAFLHDLDDRFRRRVRQRCDKDAIYYTRELLCYSLEGRRLDLLTVTSYNGITDQREPQLPSLFPLQNPRPHRFYGKRVIVVSARVHPGETPSSYVMNGFLNFILREDDWHAARLRKMYVIKLIPMLNPDGVAKGHYRTDARGVNLNRVYNDPVLELHPSAFAVKSLVLYHHVTSRRRSPIKDTHLHLSTRLSPSPVRVQSPLAGKASTPELPKKTVSVTNGRVDCSQPTKTRTAPQLSDNTTEADQSKDASPAGQLQTHSLPGLASQPPTAPAKKLYTKLRRMRGSKLVTSTRSDDSESSTSSSTSAGSERAHSETKNDEVVSCLVPDQSTFKILLQDAETKLPNITAAQHREAVAALLATLQECDSNPHSKSVSSVSTKLLEGESEAVVGNVQEEQLKSGYVTMSQEWLTFVEHVSKLRGELTETLRVMRQSLKPDPKPLEPSKDALKDDCGGDADNNSENLQRGAIPKMDAATKSFPENLLKTPLSTQTQFWGSQGNVLGRYIPTELSDDIPGTHLIVPAFALQIRAEDSGVALYMDMHGHASKRGCFIYGNYFEDIENKVDCMLLPKILSVNCNYFDFNSCNFTRKNMYTQDKKDGTTRDGSGRVGVHLMTGIIRSYTLECNYNTGNMGSQCSLVTPPSEATFTPEVYEELGQSLAVSILDLENVANTGTPLLNSTYRSVQGVREWLRYYIRAPKTCLFPVPMYTRPVSVMSHRNGAIPFAFSSSSNNDVMHSVRMNAMATAMANASASWPPPNKQQGSDVTAAGDGDAVKPAVACSVLKPKKLMAKEKQVSGNDSYKAVIRRLPSRTLLMRPLVTRPLGPITVIGRNIVPRKVQAVSPRTTPVGRKSSRTKSTPAPTLMRCCRCARVLWRRTNSEVLRTTTSTKRRRSSAVVVNTTRRNKRRSSPHAVRRTTNWNRTWWVAATQPVRTLVKSKVLPAEHVAGVPSKVAEKPYHLQLQEIQSRKLKVGPKVKSGTCKPVAENEYLSDV